MRYLIVFLITILSSMFVLSQNIETNDTVNVADTLFIENELPEDTTLQKGKVNQRESEDQVEMKNPSGDEIEEPGLKQNVIVVSEYTPTISDAFKINDLPEIKDTSSYTPKFEYALRSKPIPVDFTPEPIKPAKMLDEPLVKLYKGYIKLGIGSNVNPFADLLLNETRSKKHSYGVRLRHQSAFTNVNNEIDQKVFSGYNDNLVNVFGKKFLKNRSVLSGYVRFDYNNYYYSGYNTADTALQEIFKTDKDSMENQQLMNVETVVRYKSANLSKRPLSYDFKLKHYYFADNDANAENGINFSTKLSKYVEKELISGILDVHYSMPGFSDTTNLLVKFNPYAERVTGEWKVKAGILVETELVDSVSAYTFYPDFHLQYSIADNILIPYIGMNGEKQVNSYRSLFHQNRYVVQGIALTKNTRIRKNIYAGIKGLISKRLSFDINARYKEVRNEIFFRTDETTLFDNKFLPMYGDMDYFAFSGALKLDQSKNLSFLLNAKYYLYDYIKVDDNYEAEEIAWYHPDYDAGITSIYNLQDKILLSLDLKLTGDRKALSFDNDGQAVVSNMGMWVDADLSAEYRYSKILSGFIKLKNLSGQKYKQWLHYPGYGFNVLMGISYKL